MNLKTTIVLLALVVAGGIAWLVGFARPTVATSPSLAVLEELKPDQVTRVEIAHGDHQVVLERSPGGEWTMPGNWPTRRPEVEELVSLLCGLRSRFAPLALSDTVRVSDYGLSAPEVSVKIEAAGKPHFFLFGEEFGGTENRFSRPTYARIDSQPEIVRLGPGILAALDRPADYYLQRRLFPAERIKQGEQPEKIEQLAARSLTLSAPKTEDKKPAGSAVTLTKTGDEWVLSQPYKDLPDPDKLKALLSAVPDLWVELFVDKPDKDLAKYGLDKPEQTLSVVLPGGETVALLVGKQSRTKTRTVTRPAPPFQQPGMPRMPPQQETIHDEYRYAKLANNDQVFEIKADKLKDIFVGVDTLRDARLARFSTADVKRMEVVAPGRKLVLVKDGFTWKLEEPVKGDAESSKVTELLDKLSGLSASAADVIEKPDAKMYGLEQPAEIVTVAVEETKGEAKTKKTKTFVFELGKREGEKKVAVRVAGRDRVNLVDDSLAPLVARPALAYRGRKLFPSSDLAKIEIERRGEKFALEKDKEKFTWRLTAPVQADADGEKANKLAGDLGGLEAVEYVADNPKPQDLETTYGLKTPAVSAAVTYTKDGKPETQTLQIGKARDGKSEFYAKLAGSPNVFAVKKELFDSLEQSSLALRPQQLWDVPPDDVTAIELDKPGAAYRLRRDGAAWKIGGPFDAGASSEAVKPVLDDMAKLKVERYEAHAGKDLAAYGLDKPYLRVVLTSTTPKPEPPPPADAKKNDKKETAKEDKKADVKQRVLLIGKPTTANATTRFAKLGDAEAVFVVGGPLVAALDRGALDLLDRNLLALDPKNITRLKSTGSEAWTAERKGDQWHFESGPAKFIGDNEVVAGALGAWSKLQADRIAAYGPKVDWKVFGLDKPTRTITATVAAKDDKSKPVEHTLAIGNNTNTSTVEYHVRLDNGPAVAVLRFDNLSPFTHSYLDFVERTLLKLDPAGISGLTRKMGNEDLELVRRDGAWQLIKPADLRADDTLADELTARLAGLRAKRVAAFPAADLKPFGLDAPAAVWKIRLAGPAGKAAEHTLRVGKVADEASGDRFASVDTSAVVAVLPGELCRRLLALPLQFRDRAIARLRDADRVVLTRGERKAVFEKVDGTWKLVEPATAEAEHGDLEDFVNALTRLKADEWVADKAKPTPADLKAYGLDAPVARWQVQAEKKDLLDLTIGKKSDGKRTFAKVAGNDLVFLLDPKQSERALAEYRARKVWATPLDSAQIDRVKFGYRERPFTLEKGADGTWSLAGNPLGKVNADTVRETLVALADLKAERYATDKAADLALYGLKPPQLTIEVQTPSGVRSLEIGRMEDGSKRHYARVPTETGTEVFLIGEAESAKLVRDRQAFEDKAAKGAGAAPK